MPKFSTTGLFSGGESGAALGASFGGPMGALAGGALGGLTGGLFGNQGRKSPGVKQVPTMNQDQLAGLSQLMQLFQQQGSSNVPRGFDALAEYLDPQSGVYDALQAPAMQQWNERLMPGIAERFGGGYGAESGALSSSGFGQALGGGMSELLTNLAGMRAQMQQQSASSLIDKYRELGATGLGASPFDYIKTKGKPSSVMSGLSGLSDRIGDEGRNQGYSMGKQGIKQLLSKLGLG